MRGTLGEEDAGKIARVKSCGPIASLAIEAWFLPHVGGRIDQEQRESARRNLFDPLEELTNAIEFALPPVQNFRNAQSAADASRGGALIPGESMSDLFQETLTDVAPLRRLCTLHRFAKAATRTMPVLTDTVEGVEKQENVSEPQTDLTFGQMRLTARTFSSLRFVVPNALHEDSPEHAARMIVAGGAARIARAQNRAFTNTFVSQATAVSAAAAGSIVRDDIIDLLAQVSAYMDEPPGLTFMFHGNTLGSLLKAETSNDKIFENGLVLGKFPFFTNSHIDATLASGQVSVLCGNFKFAHIADSGVARADKFVEPLAEMDQSLWRLSMRSDAGLAISAAMGALTH